MLLVRETNGTARYLLLVSRDGKPVNKQVLELVAEPVRLAFRWDDGSERGASFVELTLIPVDEGTRVRVVESGPSALAGRLPSLAAASGLVRA